MFCFKFPSRLKLVIWMFRTIFPKTPPITIIPYHPIVTWLVLQYAIQTQWIKHSSGKTFAFIDYNGALCCSYRRSVVNAGDNKFTILSCYRKQSGKTFFRTLFRSGANDLFSFRLGISYWYAKLWGMLPPRRIRIATLWKSRLERWRRMVFVDRST